MRPILLGLSLTLSLPLLWSGGSLDRVWAASGLNAGGVFDQPREFPNYFLPEQYRRLPPSQVPPEVVAKVKSAFEAALGSVFERMTVPVVPPGEKSVRPVRYFPLLRSELLQLDPAARVYASGGVVRAAITYLYDELHREIARSPASTAEELLARIVSATDEIPALRIRGVGSDFDILISSEKFFELKARAEEITDSAARFYGGNIRKGTLKNSLFTLGDVRDYEQQIHRSTVQGGTTVDYLAYEVGGRKLRNPERFPSLAEDVLRGVFDFAPPAEGRAMEDVADSAIRGYRTLMEMPWLKLRDEGAFRSALSTIMADLQTGQLPSERARGQFAKGVRNSRYFGAHNRFYRAAPGSIDAEIMKLAKTLGQRVGRTLLPEFVDHLPTEARGADRGLKGLPETLLMDADHFRACCTDQGVLYHGTPSMETALAILRQGLFVSSSEQGRAALGRGGYASSNRDFARNYAQEEGLVIDLKLKNSPATNILDWNKAKQHPFVRKLIESAKMRGLDPFKVLAREHGIDIIANNDLRTTVLIQNAAVLEMPSRLGDLARMFTMSLRGGEAKNVEEAVQLSQRLQLLDFAEHVGEAPLMEVDIKMLARPATELLLASGDSSHVGTGVALALDRLPPAEAEAKILRKFRQLGMTESEDLGKAIVAVVLNEKMNLELRNPVASAIRLLPIREMENALLALLHRAHPASNAAAFRAAAWDRMSARVDPVLQAALLNDDVVDEALSVLMTHRPLDSQKRLLKKALAEGLAQERFETLVRLLSNKEVMRQLVREPELPAGLAQIITETHRRSRDARQQAIQLAESLPLAGRVEVYKAGIARADAFTFRLIDWGQLGPHAGDLILDALEADLSAANDFGLLAAEEAGLRALKALPVEEQRKTLQAAIDRAVRRGRKPGGRHIALEAVLDDPELMGLIAHEPNLPDVLKTLIVTAGRYDRKGPNAIAAAALLPEETALDVLRTAVSSYKGERGLPAQPFKKLGIKAAPLIERLLTSRSGYHYYAGAEALAALPEPEQSRILRAALRKMPQKTAAALGAYFKSDKALAPLLQREPDLLPQLERKGQASALGCLFGAIGRWGRSFR